MELEAPRIRHRLFVSNQRRRSCLDASWVYTVVTGEAAEALARCLVLAIEANHDQDMLARGPCPAFLKARIAVDRGHLSNAQSAGLRVSQNNNDYRLPRVALAAVLGREGHPARALAGFQERPVSV